MSKDTQNTLNLKDARIAGALYLTIAVCGGFSIGYVPSQIVVGGNVATTAANLMTQLGLFRLGVLADSAVILLEIAITVILYQIFSITSPRLSLIAMVSRFPAQDLARMPNTSRCPPMERSSANQKI